MRRREEKRIMMIMDAAVVGTTILSRAYYATLTMTNRMQQYEYRTMVNNEYEEEDEEIMQKQ